MSEVEVNHIPRTESEGPALQRTYVFPHETKVHNKDQAAKQGLKEVILFYTE